MLVIIYIRNVVFAFDYNSGFLDMVFDRLKSVTNSVFKGAYKMKQTKQN